jgi:hypothetical protein
MGKLIVTMPLICGAQVAMGLFFYRSRAVSDALWAGSNWVVFGIPVIVGFAAFACVLFLSFSQVSPAKRIAGTLGLALAAAAVSFFVSILIALNLYGT